MSLAVVYSRTNSGLDAPLVSVEVHLANGLPSFSIVGLPETAVKESRDRVRAALTNSGFNFPVRRITVNLAPADIPKDGGRFDLPIAIGMLASSEQVATETLQNYEFIGELSLGGHLRPVRGVLPTAFAALQAGRALIVPQENAAEASLIRGLKVFAAQHISEVVEHLYGSQPLVRWEQAMNRSLLMDSEKSTVFTKFNVDGLLRGDYASRMSGYATARQNGWMSANDIRELENLDRIPAEQGGDLYLINGAMTKLQDAGAFANTTTTEMEEPSDGQNKSGAKPRKSPHQGA